MNKKFIALIIVAIFGSIISSGILYESNSAPGATVLVQELSITKVETMPAQLILDLYNKGTTAITLDAVIINGTAVTSKLVYDTWLSNVPANVPTSILFNFDWHAGNRYNITLMYPHGQTSILALF